MLYSKLIFLPCRFYEQNFRTYFPIWQFSEISVIFLNAERFGDLSSYIIGTFTFLYFISRKV